MYCRKVIGFSACASTWFDQFNDNRFALQKCCACATVRNQNGSIKVTVLLAEECCTVPQSKFKKAEGRVPGQTDRVRSFDPTLCHRGSFSK